MNVCFNLHDDDDDDDEDDDDDGLDARGHSSQSFDDDELLS
jgi:hypothetical protein